MAETRTAWVKRNMNGLAGWVRTGTGLLVLLGLQDDVDRLDDGYVPVCLAIDDDVVNVLLHAGHIDRMLFGEAVVPPAVPDPQEVRVFLKCAGELSAGELLNVYVALGVGIFGELGLCGRTADAKDPYGGDEGQVATHVDIPSIEQASIAARPGRNFCQKRIKA